MVVARSWSEELPDGTSVRLGVWLSNVKSRRATLTGEQQEQLAGLGSVLSRDHVARVRSLIQIMEARRWSPAW
ncbi:hypothetical protein [Streptomyces sp. NPDC048142]|uniref:hypothetical protein n=1 Tax=Streptomyces sp. NPDC048142 TaxID=3365501 RepID=UPI00371DF180